MTCTKVASGGTSLHSGDGQFENITALRLEVDGEQGGEPTSRTELQQLVATGVLYLVGRPAGITLQRAGIRDFILGSNPRRWTNATSCSRLPCAVRR